MTLNIKTDKGYTIQLSPSLTPLGCLPDAPMRQKIKLLPEIKHQLQFIATFPGIPYQTSL